MADAIDADTVLVVASAPVLPARRRRPGDRDRHPRAGRRRPLPRRRLHRRLAAALPAPRRPGVPAYSASWCPGVTSISVDLHKYGYTPKGVSLLLHRSRGAPPAAAVRQRGLARLHDAQHDDAVHPLGRPAGRGLGDHPADRRRRLPGAGPAGPRRAGHPGRRRRRRASTCGWSAGPTRACWRWPPTTPSTSSPLADELLARGWYAQPQLSSGPVPRHPAPVGQRGHRPAAAGVPRGPGRRGRRRASPRARRRPTRAWPRVLAELDPASLDDAGFDQLLAMAGLADGPGRRPCPPGWPPSTPSSTRRRPRCARPCWSATSTGSADPSGRPWWSGSGS